MAQFVFQLEGVLRHREHVEERKRRDLSEVMRELAALDAKLRQLDREFRASADDLRSNRLVGQLDMAWLAGHRRYTVAMRRRVTALVEQMAAVRVRVDAAQKVLNEAVVQRKIIEKLRDNRKARWNQEQARKETAAIDEIGAQMGYRSTIAAEDDV